MKRGVAMRRRDALFGAVAAMVLGGAGSVSAGEQVGAAAPLHATVLSMFKRPDGAAAVGRAYLAQLPPGVASLDALSRAVLDTLPPMVSPATIRARIRRDFAEAEMVMVEGWLLSLTEARVYALAALGHERATS